MSIQRTLLQEKWRGTSVLWPVDHDYRGLIVPTNGEPTIRQVAQALVPPQYPEGGVHLLFQLIKQFQQEAPGTDDAPPDA
eukprot:4508419-Amphidinium_carterae.1